MTPPLFVNVVNLDVPLVRQPTTLLTLSCTGTHLCPPLPHSSTLTLILPILHPNKLLASKGSRTPYSLPLNKLHLCPVPFPTWFHQFDNIPHLLLSHLLRLLLHKHGLNWLKRLKMMRKTLQNSKWISMTIIPTNPFK